MPEVMVQGSGAPAQRPESGRGYTRAAAVLLGLGADAAGPVFRELAEQELRMVALGAKGLRTHSPEAVPDALRAFIAAMESVGGETAVSDHVLREAAAKALV